VVEAPKLEFNYRIALDIIALVEVRPQAVAWSCVRLRKYVSNKYKFDFTIDFLSFFSPLLVFPTPCHGSAQRFGADRIPRISASAGRKLPQAFLNVGAH
jgi:hypothetical protein